MTSVWQQGAALQSLELRLGRQCLEVSAVKHDPHEECICDEGMPVAREDSSLGQIGPPYTVEMQQQISTVLLQVCVL